MREYVQRRAVKLMKGLRNKTDEVWLKNVGLFSVEEESLNGDLITLYNRLTKGCSKESVYLFSQATSDREMASGCTRESQTGYQEEFLHGEGDQALKVAAHGVPMPGSI